MSGCIYPYCLFCDSGLELIAVGKTVIGRALLPTEHVNVVNLDSPRCAVSRLQAEIIVLDNGDAWVKDCNSTNGTFISIHPSNSSSGLRLAENHYYQLTPGTRLIFGDVEREFRVYSELFSEQHTTLHNEETNAFSSRDTDKLHSHAHDEQQLPQQQQHCQSNNSLVEQSSNDTTACRETSESIITSYNRNNINSDDKKNMHNTSIEHSHSAMQNGQPEILERSAILNNAYEAPEQIDFTCSEGKSNFMSNDKMEPIIGTTKAATAAAAVVETPVRTINEEGKETIKQNKYTARENYHGLSPELLPLSQCGQDPLLYSSINSNNETCDSDDGNNDNTSAIELKEREVNVLIDASDIKSENRKRSRQIYAEEKETLVENVVDNHADVSKEKKKNNTKKKKKEEEEEEIKLEQYPRTWKWEELKICLSGMDLSEKTKISRKICKHGACVVNDITDANCLIVHTPAVRTPKVIIAAGRGIPILNSSILSHSTDLTLHDLETATATIQHENSTYTPEVLCQVAFRANRSLILEGTYYNLSSLPKAVSSVASDIIVKCGGVICNNRGTKKLKESCKVVCLNQEKLNEVYEQIMRGQRNE